MEQAINILNNNLLYIVLGLIVLVIILLVFILISFKKMSKIQKRYEKFMSKENIDLEELLVQYTKKLNTLLSNEKDILTAIKKIEEELAFCVQKVGIVRYTAIANTGADLSFAIAILDSQNDGVVLNGIYSRDGSYTYAKPIQDAKSHYTLSDEEKQAINKALEKKGPLA